MAGAGAVGAGGSGAGSRGSGAGNSSGRAGGSGARAGGTGARAGGSGAGASRSGRPGGLTSIAASAGVSVSTVSKVLNGRTDVAPETRERLGRILRTHGYQVAPRSGIGVVDLLIGQLGGLWSDELIRGAGTGAAETEISVIVSRVTSAGEFDRWL